MYDGWSWSWVVPMMLCTVLFIAAIVGVLVVMMRSGVLPHQRTPEEVLAERFARGEIDATEYNWRLDALHEQRTMTTR
jgi:putative membrane protein